MGGSSSPQINLPKPVAPPILHAPDYSPLFDIQKTKGQQQTAAFGDLGNYLQMIAGAAPLAYTPNIASQNKQILDQAIINAQQGRDVEKQLDPKAAKMRQDLSTLVETLTSPQGTQDRLNQWLKTSGLEKVFGSGTGLSTIGASGLADASTEAGYQNMLRNLNLRQQYLGQAPSVGLSPQAAASQIEAAKQQALNQYNAFNQNIMSQGGGLMSNAFAGGQGLLEASKQLTAQDIQNLYQTGLQNALMENQYQQASQNTALQQAQLDMQRAQQQRSGTAGIMGGIGSALGGVAGSVYGGPMGGMAGATIGSAAGTGLGSMF